jgi:hypothetical protein
MGILEQNEKIRNKRWHTGRGISIDPEDVGIERRKWRTSLGHPPIGPTPDRLFLIKPKMM